ncbi:MAG TPA: electron transfer flavoprotein subunit beta/FixA family protein [Bacteroidota bacterium]|nr:electron transfer flavoprotein subunit beta/FixA family protein [Bacteroidota bacterium]
MKILVCVKQVADMESAFKIDAAGTWIDEREIAFRMNEYDEYAVEQAVRIKEQREGDTDITILSIGPQRVTETVKKALAMGGDRGVHVSDDASARKDPWQIASIIAAFAIDKQFDLIFTGMQSQDRGSAQVGVFTAERLGIPCVTTVVEFVLEGGDVTAARELEGGVKMIVKFGLPAVVTCQLGLNRPRYPTLPNIMKARQKEIKSIPVSELLNEDPLLSVEKIYHPEKKNHAVVLEGEVSELADRVAVMLKEKSFR